MTRYSLGKGTVIRLLRSQGVTLRHRSLTEDQVLQAIPLYQQGWSLAKVGQHFGWDDSLIYLY
jgi:hypothetical protein